VQAWQIGLIGLLLWGAPAWAQVPSAAPGGFESQPPPPSLPQPDRPEQNYRVTALQRDYRGNLWVGSWQGLAQIDPNTGRILSRISLPNTLIGDLAEDRVGRIWV